MLLNSSCVQTLKFWQTKDSENIEVQKINHLKVQLDQAFFVSEKLLIKVRIDINTDFPADKIVVFVLGLKEGNEVESQYKILKNEINSDLVHKGESYQMVFEMNGRTFNEFQIKCNFGSDALTALAAYKLSHPEIEKQLEQHTQTYQALKLEDVELKKESENCINTNCKTRFSIKAQLKNYSEAKLNNIKLAVGIIWRDSNSKTLENPPLDYQQKLENEEELDLSSILLEPNESKKIKVNVDRDIPQKKNGEYLPYIRILNIRE